MGRVLDFVRHAREGSRPEVSFLEACRISIYVKKNVWASGRVQRLMPEENLLYDAFSGTISGVPNPEDAGWIPCSREGNPL